MEFTDAEYMQIGKLTVESNMLWHRIHSRYSKNFEPIDQWPSDWKLDSDYVAREVIEEQLREFTYKAYDCAEATV